MSYSFKWQPNSEYPYFEGADFILLKWNAKEVQKFDEHNNQNY